VAVKLTVHNLKLFKNVILLSNSSSEMKLKSFSSHFRKNAYELSVFDGSSWLSPGGTTSSVFSLLLPCMWLSSADWL